MSVYSLVDFSRFNPITQIDTDLNELLDEAEFVLSIPDKAY